MIHKKTGVCVIGAGTMGQGIAQLSALTNRPTYVVDRSEAALEKCRAGLESIFERLETKGKLSAADRELAWEQLKFSTELRGLDNCHLVIEAVAEDLAIKQNLFAEVEDLVADDCILATNTSSFSVTALAANLRHPGRVAGLHFFNPAPLMKVVEIVQGLKTNAACIEQLRHWVELIGHKGVRCIDSPGFIVNHAGRGYGTEALRILEESIAPAETVDRVLKGTGLFRMGPFELLDLIGLDVSHKVMESVYHQFYEEPRFRPSNVAKTRVAGGLLGRKTGVGFYAYDRETENKRPSSPTKVDVTLWLPPSVDREKILSKTGATISEAKQPSESDLIVIPLWGEDLSSVLAACDYDPKRCFAIDLLGEQEVTTLSASPLCSDVSCDKILSAFNSEEHQAVLIDASPGFITQRVLAMIVNIGCEIVQKNICSPADLDSAVELGLGYKLGPLALGDKIGPQMILKILDELHGFYGDPRYRPSPWLKRRALLNMPLTEHAHYKKEHL